jgi:hypothetical protein
VLYHEQPVQLRFEGQDFTPVYFPLGLDCVGDEATLASCPARDPSDTVDYDYDGSGAACRHSNDAVIWCTDDVDAGALSAGQLYCSFKQAGLSSIFMIGSRLPCDHALMNSCSSFKLRTMLHTCWTSYREGH